MKTHEREELKRIGYPMARTGKTPEVRAEGNLMLMTAHFYRNPKAPDFLTYASNWLAANCHEIDVKTMRLLKPRFPACTKRMIETGYSDWGSYGKASYRRCTM